MTLKTAAHLQPVAIAGARRAVRRVFIRDLVLSCRIGVHAHEKDAKQRIRVNIDLDVRDDRVLDDDLANVVCYEQITMGVRTIVAIRHIKLVETVAEEIASMCLEDRRVHGVRVRVEKLDILPDAASVGVEIERFAQP